MFGVIDFSDPILFLYPDLSSAISFFFRISGADQNKDVSIQPNLNNSLYLLLGQDNLYHVSLGSFHLPPATSILNVAILRNEDLECSLGSVLLNLSEEEIESLSSHYKINEITYDKKKCSLCNSKFKIWDTDENCGYQGCVYKPCYYQVVTLDNLEDYHVFGSQKKVDSEIEKLNLDKFQIFFINMRGGPEGLYLSKIPLPDNLKQDSDICWSCMREMENDFIFIWGH